MIRFAYVNRASAAATTLTASTAQSALPVTAIKNSDRSYIWRSLTQTTTQAVDVDLGSVLAVDAAFVANVKLLGTGLLELYHRGDAASPGAAVLVGTFPAQDRDRRVAFVFPAAAAHRHWQVKWTNPTSASDYAELGHLFLGQYLEPARNVRFVMPFVRQDPSVVGMSIDGQKTFATRTKYAAGEWHWPAVVEAGLSELRTMFDTVGVHTPHYVALSTSLAWTVAYTRFMTQLDQSPAAGVGLYSVTLAWEEVR